MKTLADPSCPTSRSRLHRGHDCLLALMLMAGLSTGQAFADDDGDPSVAPVDPGTGYIGIYPNPTLPPDFIRDQGTSPWGLTTLYNAVSVHRVGQKFTAGLSSIDWVGFVFQSSNQGGTLGPAEYRVRIAESIHPTTGHLVNVLGTTISETIPMGATGWFLFKFPESIPLTPGNSYYLGIDYVSGYTGGPGGTGIGVGGRNNSVYPGGHFTGYWDSMYGIQPWPIMNGSSDLIFATGIIDTPTAAPAPPTLTATAGYSRVTLTWTVAAGARTYRVQRATTPGGQDQILATTGALGYEDVSVVNGTTYYYRVSAVNSLGDANSNESAATPQTPPPPLAPDQLVATATLPGQINLAWRDNSTDESGFDVERSADGQTFAVIATVGANITRCGNIAGLAPDTTYTYRVRAVGTHGASAYSNQASAKTLPLPPPPSAPTGSISTLLQQNLSGGNKMDIKRGQKVAQSFRHGASGGPSYFITKVALRLSREMDAPNAPLNVSLGTGINTGALPGSTQALAPTQITDSSAGSSFRTLEITFPTPVGPLTSGRTYSLNLDCEASNGKAIYIECSGNNTYAGGSNFKSGSNEGKDLWFQIVGSNGVPASVPPPAPPDITPPASPLQQSPTSGSKADVKSGKTGSQSFRHGSAGGPSYSASKLVLRLSRESEMPDADLLVSLGSARNGGTIPGSTVRIPPSRITDTSAGSTFMTLEIDYSSSVVPLAAGATYFINVSCEAPNGKTLYTQLSEENTYLGGTYFEGTSDQGKDAWFEIWGQ